MRAAHVILSLSLAAFVGCGRETQADPKIEYPANVPVPESIENSPETSGDGLYVLGAPIYLQGHYEAYRWTILAEDNRIPLDRAKTWRENLLEREKRFIVGQNDSGAIARFEKGRPYFEQGMKDGEALAREQMRAVESRFGWVELQSQMAEAETNAGQKVVGAAIGSSVHRSHGYDEVVEFR